MMLDVVYVRRISPAAAGRVPAGGGQRGWWCYSSRRWTRSRLDVCLRTAAQLAQAGEFGLVLIQLGYSLKLIGWDVFQLTLSAMLVSMFVAPFLISHGRPVSQGRFRAATGH